MPKKTGLWVDIAFLLMLVDSAFMGLGPTNLVDSWDFVWRVIWTTVCVGLQVLTLTLVWRDMTYRPSRGWSAFVASVGLFIFITYMVTVSPEEGGVFRDIRNLSWGAFMFFYGLIVLMPVIQIPARANRQHLRKNAREVGPPALNTHKGCHRPKIDWDCFRIFVCPIESPYSYRPIWAMISASTISFISAELCEALGGKYSGTGAALAGVPKSFNAPIAMFNVAIGWQFFEDVPVGVSADLRRTAGVDFLASRELAFLARQMRINKLWSECPRTDRPAIYPRPKNVAFVSFTRWASPEESNGDSGEETIDQE